MSWIESVVLSWGLLIILVHGLSTFMGYGRICYAGQPNDVAPQVWHARMQCLF